MVAIQSDIGPENLQLPFIDRFRLYALFIKWIKSSYSLLTVVCYIHLTVYAFSYVVYVNLKLLKNKFIHHTVIRPGWTTYVIHLGIFFFPKLYNGGNFSTIWQNKTHFYTILTTNLYDKSQTKVLFTLIILKKTCHLSNHSDNISFWCYIQHKKILGCMMYIVNPGSSIKRKCCQND